MDKKIILVIALMMIITGLLSGCTELGPNAGKATVDWKLDVTGYSVNPLSGMDYIEKGGSEIITFTVYCSHKQNFRLNQKQTSNGCLVKCPGTFSNYVDGRIYTQKQITITISTASSASQETVYIEYIPV